MNDPQGMPIGHTIVAMDFLMYRLIPMSDGKYIVMYQSDIPGGLYYLVIDRKVVLATSIKALLLNAMHGEQSC